MDGKKIEQGSTVRGRGVQGGMGEGHRVTVALPKLAKLKLNE